MSPWWTHLRQGQKRRVVRSEINANEMATFVIAAWEGSRIDASFVRSLEAFLAFTPVILSKIEERGSTRKD
jgi:hypothetical protein